MDNHNKQGKDAELISFMILQRDNYNILHTNWKCKKAEVNIIAEEDEFLLFVEVKTRGNKKYGKPSGAIDNHTILLYKDAVEGYLEQFPLWTWNSFWCNKYHYRKRRNRNRAYP